jgi:predicted RNA polymerase sigma factor
MKYVCLVYACENDLREHPDRPPDAECMAFSDAEKARGHVVGGQALQPVSTATTGEELIRASLCREAIRLGRTLQALLPDPEIDGFLALMLLQHSRYKSRVDAGGDLVRLENQDRRRWDQAAIAEGCRAGFHLAHAARAEFCTELGRFEEAKSAFARALELAEQEPERRHLKRRLAEISG